MSLTLMHELNHYLIRKLYPDLEGRSIDEKEPG
jgi:hypothetical protein